MKNQFFDILRGFCIVLVCTAITSCNIDRTPTDEKEFYAEESEDQVKVYLKGQTLPVVIQNAKSDFRPYIHPIKAPQSAINLTEVSPGHHLHQTGLFWGFTRVNGSETHPDTLKKWFYRSQIPKSVKDQIGRDYFHNPGKDYWRRVSFGLLNSEGEEIRWNTVYDMLDEEGRPILRETQTWTFRQLGEYYLLSLEWKGNAIVDITINEFDYGGLFLRMPWRKENEGEVVNIARQRNEKAEGQRAMWVDVGMAIEGLPEWGHIALFDHPKNDGFPQKWRVDGQLGVGPVRARMGDWEIAQGDSTIFKHQIVAYSGEFSDVKLDELWTEYSEGKGLYNKSVLWTLARREGHEAKFLSPTEAVEEMTIKDGYAVNVFASEPMITQPMAFCWDNRGRMWIAENRDYESRGTGFSNSGDSRILILEDTDRDGTVDKRTIFYEGIPFPSAIAVGFDGLFLGAPPNLLFIPDRDQNDIPESEDIKVLLTGWGIRDRHETINSLHWGPDGWLYGLEGFATPSKIRKPKGKGRIYRAYEEFPKDLLESNGVDINGGVWRFHPVKERFEVVAHGFSNPWGIDYDAKGQLFISACVIPHLFHVIPGGIYHRQGGRHFNPHIYKDIRTIVDHRHRSAHGGARVYQSDAFPREQHGRIFMANIHEHAVLSDILIPQGSGYKASHGEDFMLANNAQWIGFSMEIGPEGGLYVLDWHDADICGTEVKNKETGRVFRMMPEDVLAEQWEGRYDDLDKFSDQRLVELQSIPSDWHARRSRLILQKRVTTGPINSEAIESLFKLLKSKNTDHRLRALWSLYLTNSIQADYLIRLLSDPDPYIRGWSIQLLCEDKNPLPEAMDQMIKMARTEKSAVVRLYLAAALQRINDEDRWNITKGLIKHSEDADDHNIPKMIWFGIEPLVESNPEQAISLISTNSIPLISNHIARRLVAAGKMEYLLPALEKRTNRFDLLEGMLAGLESQTDIVTPAGWNKVYQSLISDPKLSSIALLVAQRLGSLSATKEMLDILSNQQVEVNKKLNAITGLASQQNQELIQMVPDLINDPNLSVAIIRSIASYSRKEFGELLLNRYADFNQEEKQEAIHTLASRPVYGQFLAQAIKDKQIPRKEIPAYVARQLRRVVGNGFVEIWGPIDQLSSDFQAEYTKYEKLLTDQAIASANLNNGQKIFKTTCGPCHQMYGTGGMLGPDLTGSNRTNTTYLLSNIIEPSSDIQDDYKMVIITTLQGRTYSGNIVSESEREVAIRVVGQEDIKIRKSEIQSREITPKSMMPEGLLKNMTDQEVLDLIAYLKHYDHNTSH